MRNCQLRIADCGLPKVAPVQRIGNRQCSDAGLGFAQAGDSIAVFPLAALFEDFDALEALEDVPFCAGSAGGAQAAML
jgi:hypothetical protein